jgi:hypothetical protein
MRRPHKTDQLTTLEYGIGWEGRHNAETGEWEYTDRWGRTKEEILEDYQEHKSKLDSVSGVYQRANRIITGDEITVTVVDDPDMDCPARSNGRDIEFNANLIEDLDTDSILSLHGLNFHEIAHVLYSPRKGSDLGQYVITNKMKRAMNVLEEARIETLLANKYPITKLFLEASTTDYLLKDSPSEWGNQYLTITGRTYLGLDLRQMVADKFIAKHGVELADRLHKLIHEYKGLVFPTDFDRAKTIITELSEIIGKDNEGQPQWSKEQGHGHNGEERDMPTRGRPEGAKEQQRLQDKDKANPKQLEGIKPSVGAGGADDSIYNGEERDFTEEDNAIAKKLTERMSEIKKDEYVKRQVSETRKAIVGSDEARSAMRNATYNNETPNEVSIGLARRFGIELERIVRDNDPYWERRTRSGKLNVARTMTPDVNAISSMFDTWDTGNENTDIEAVVLLDNSSSMGGLMRKVCENAWIIKRGIESIQGEVTMYSFCHESKLLYNKVERAKPRTFRFVQATGNTNPIRGLMEAERTLTQSEKSVKLLFIVTDGQWEMTEECDSIIKKLNDRGIVTCVVFLGDLSHYKSMMSDSEYTEYATNTLKSLRHGARIFKSVVEPRDVLKIATELVKTNLSRKRVA